MTAIQKVFEDGTPDSKSIAFLNQFFLSQASEWDWDLFQHLPFENGLTDYWVQNLNGERAARQSLSAELNLTFPTLDWCWVNAKASRTLDFIKFYRDHQHTLSEAAGRQMIDLTVASIDKAVRERRLIHVTEAEDFLSSIEWTDSARLEPSVREFSTMWSPETLGVELSKQLHLRFPSLDWTSVNASVVDLEKFVSLYAEGREACRPLAWYHRLGGLIFQSLSLIDCKEKITPETDRSIAKFLSVQGGELASRLATWLQEGPKPTVEGVVREMIAIYSRNSSWDSFSARFGCRENGKDASSILEFGLNCLFDFPLWTGNQDWGYCYRDGMRLQTFISFFLSLPSLKCRDSSAAAHFRMHELIMYSLERAMDMDLMDEAAIEATTAFARSEARKIVNWHHAGIKPTVEEYLEYLQDGIER